MTTSVSTKGNSNATDAPTQEVFVFPASFSQRRLWFLYQLYPDSAAYNIPGIVRIRGPLDVGALERSLQEIVRRHESLRTHFAVIDGEPHQIIALETPIQLPVISLTSFPGDREAEARRRAREESIKPFDVSRGPLLRAVLLRLGESDHVLLFTMHHIISDGWSMGVLVKETSLLYTAFSAGRPSPLPELPIQYADFSEWNRERLQGELLEEQLSYWKKQLEGLTALELPTDYPRSAGMGQNGASVPVIFSSELSEALQHLSEQNGVTLFMTLLATFQLLLHRYTGQQDIAVGSPIAGRTRTETEALIGFFVNTLVLRIKLSMEWSFIELLRHVQETTVDAYAHQDVPFEKLVDELQPERDLTRTPLFQVMFALQNAPFAPLQLGATRLEPFEFEVGTAKFDLMLTLNESRSAIRGLMEYNMDLFKASTVSRIANQFQTLLTSIVSDPRQTIADIPMLTQSERQQLLVDWNGAKEECPSGWVHEKFMEQAQRTPQALAVLFEGRRFTYQELDQRSNQLARYLKKLGVAPEALVGICVERSLEMVVGLLGVLKAGGAYVPMDPNYPSDRLRYMIEETQSQVLLMQEKFRDWIRSCTSTRLVSLDGNWDEIAQESDGAVHVPLNGENLAYIIFTSGSSGTPKGAAISHAALSNHMFWMNQSFLSARGERVLQKTPFSFDASVWEFYAPLLNDGILVMAHPEGHQDSGYLVRTLQTERISVLQVVPSLLELLVQEQGLSECKSLKWLFCGGEALSQRLVDEVKNHLEVELINLYGPTEATIDATFWRAGGKSDRTRKVAIGTPILNTRVYVLDEKMQPVPVGVVAGLYIGGAGLARGYWRRPDLTAERFVPDSLSGEAGARLYWTGDQVRWRDDGDLEYLGRADEQVKVRGYRIELGEVETALLQQPAVKQAAVTAKEDGHRQKRLVGYVVLQSDITIAELRQSLQQRLPNYMVPTVFVMLESLPLLPNGKVDRRALPPPTMEPAADDTYAVPQTPIEELLAQIWGELLGIEKLGVHDDFFQLGGHSLLATQVVARIKDSLRIEVPLRQLFETSTIAGLASALQQLARSGTPEPSPPIVRVPRNGPIPLSYAQQRLWFLDQLAPGSSWYNIPGAVRIRGSLDIPILERTLQEIVRRHEVLRTRLGAVQGEPRQVIDPDFRLELPVFDLSSLPEDKRQGEVKKQAREEAQQPFDLAQGPLLRAKLLVVSDQEHVLLVTMHHIVSDGWSIGVMVKEISALYQAFQNGLPSRLPELPIQYADFSAWQRNWLSGDVLERELDYWKRQLKGVAPLEIPTDRPRPEMMTQNGANIAVTLPAQITAELKELCRREGATLYMALLAAFQVLLHRYSGQHDISVGTPIAGRTQTETEALIGFFVNTLVLRADLHGKPGFCDMLRQVKHTTLEAYAHQEVPFEKLVDVLQPQRDLSRPPLFQAMFAWQNAPVAELRLGTAKLEQLNVESTTAKFDLMLVLFETRGEMQGGVEYNTDLFDNTTISGFIRHFQELLQGIVQDPGQRISELPMLNKAERKMLVAGWKGPELEVPSQNLNELIVRHAKQAPEAKAIIADGKQLSYAELNRNASHFAHYIRNLGIRPGARVAVCLEPGADLITAALAVLKADGVLVPLDTSEPAGRLRWMVEDSQSTLVLTHQQLGEPFQQTNANVVHMDILQAKLGSEFEDELLCTRGRFAACLLYRSSPAAQPHGIWINQQALCGAVFRSNLDINPGDHVAQSTNFFEDAGCLEVFQTLAAGACVVGIAGRSPLPPRKLASTLRDHRATVLHAPASTVLRLAREFPWALKTLRLIICDEPPRALLGLREVLKTEVLEKLYGCYGDTETGGIRMLYPVAGTIGPMSAVAAPHVAAGTSLYLLDSELEPAPHGVMADIYVGGEALSPGYEHQAASTTTAFVVNPFSQTGERLYRTGDLGRRRADGNLEYRGRHDGRIILNGIRIETGAIEAALLEHPLVREAAALPDNDPSTGQPMGISSWVVAGDGQVVTGADLRRFLEERLPEPMVPATVTVVDAIPRTSLGKVDRNALANAGKTTFVAPATATERALADIWMELLHLEKVSVRDNFFSLGGHSLLATQVVARMSNAFRVDVPLRQLFEAPTIAELSKIIEQLVETSGKRKIPPMVRVPREGELPLSFAQQRLWFLDQLMPGNAFYNAPNAIRIRGSLDLAVVEKVIREIVRRHETLRTRFLTVEGEPRQVIDAEVNLDLRIIDLSSSPEHEREGEARKLAREDAQLPFDLGQGPLLRVRLLRLAEQDHVLLLNMHHIVSDGWSMGVLIKELSVLHHAFSAGQPSPLPDLPIQYADFSAWQRSWLTGDVLEQQLNYWKRQLQGAPPALELPLDRPRPAVLSTHGAQQPVRLEPELAERLHALSQQQGATLYMTLLAVFQALLYRYTGQDDISVGSPIAGRTQTDTEGLIGFFVNTLVMRARFSGGWSFNELLRQVKEITLEAYAHQDVPFEKLVEVLSSKRDLNRAALFQVMFVLQNAPLSDLEFGPAKLDIFEVDSGTAKFELLLSLAETRSGIQGGLEYNTDLFDSDTITRLLLHYRKLLVAILDHPQQPLGTLPLLMDSERQQLLVEWNRTKAEYPCDKRLQDVIEEQVERTPNVIAVAGDQMELTYAELNRRANQLAHYLRKLGVGPEVCVGICVERSPEMFIAILAVLKSGGAFVPLDPAYPPERLTYMLEDSHAPLLLTQKKISVQLPSYAGTVVQLDQQWNEIGVQSSKNLQSLAVVENLAYVIYTSGSTGRPKGVAIRHSSVVGFVTWMHDLYTPEEMSGVLAATSICFDLSFLEIFVPLTCGGTIFVVKNAVELAGMQRPERIKSVTTVPSAIKELVRMRAVPESVCTINLAGEALPNTLVGEIFELKSVKQVHNLYGPSEDTVFTTFASLKADEQQRVVSIGRPVANRQVYVLNDWMEPAPVGVAGELYIGGDGLARGYLDRPELTAERFVPNPFAQLGGGRLYRTGDLVRYLKDGRLDFLGRVDQQVKIRGYRIELGEIEAALLDSGLVVQAVVVADEDDPSEKRLVAYIVPRTNITEGQLREALKHRLPEFMAPSVFVTLESLPLTPNGKIDRRSLPSPKSKRAALEKAYVAPRTPEEELLANIWSNLLKREPIGVNDNFFELGGHSLLAVRMRTMIQKTFNRDIPLTSLFQNPTLAHLAKLVAKSQHPAEEPSPRILVNIQPKGSGSPFFCVHPVGGSVLCYAELANALGREHPFYGLQSPVPEPGSNSWMNVEQMATLYNNEIRQVQPTGPYLLGGWSMGGLVAFEMAKQLTEQGETVSLLVMFDTHPPAMEKNADLPMLVRFAADISRQMAIDTRDLGQRFLELSPDGQWNLVRETLIHEGVLAPDRAQRQLTNLVDVFAQNSTAIDTYTLRRSGQRVILFQASEAENQHDLAQEWSKWTSGVELHRVPGDHYTMIRQPHVLAIALILQDYLTAAKQQAEKKSAKAPLILQ